MLRKLLKNYVNLTLENTLIFFLERKREIHFSAFFPQYEKYKKKNDIFSKQIKIIMQQMALELAKKVSPSSVFIKSFCLMKKEQFTKWKE